MSIAKSDTSSAYRANKATDADILISPEASKLLRGLLRLTLQRAADGASVKKNRLEHFEKEGRPLSIRDRRWLQSMFESAGAEFFMGQGELHVHLEGRPVAEFGKRAQYLCHLPSGLEAKNSRYARGLSQDDLAYLSTVPQCRISAIENCRTKKFYLADQIEIKKVFEEIPEDPALRSRIDFFQSHGWDY